MQKKIIDETNAIITSVPIQIQHGSIVNNVTLQFCRIDKDSTCDISQSTDYVIIPQITKQKHVKVCYSDEIKKQIVLSSDNPFNSIFLCNVQVIMHGDTICFYKIIEIINIETKAKEQTLLLLLNQTSHT